MFLETVSGRFIDVSDPQPYQIDIEDIGWGLSRMPRFAGQTITIQPYTVAQHCCLVTDLASDMFVSVSPKLSLMCLLHDAAEAYIGDIPSPIKKHPAIKDAIKDFEYGLLNRIYAKFHLPEPTEDERAMIKACDMKALALEANSFMQSRGRGEHWHNMPAVHILELQAFAEPKTSVEAFKTFMSYFNHYYQQMRSET